MTQPLRLPAPAKLNLFLHITGRRADGYHTLQTIFQFIDLCDWLTFSVLDTPDIKLTPPLAGVQHEQNLIVRAAQLLQRHAKIDQGVSISLEKNLPLGGGLGGGSSDAATTLLALNTLWNCQLSLPELAELGLSLGADVPVFVLGHAAWAEGVGEKITPIDIPEPWYALLIPADSIETAQAFSHPRLTRNSDPITLRAFLAGETRNDFEKVVRELSPAVDEAMKWLALHGDAKMTGTGCCVYTPCTQHEKASAIIAVSPIKGFVCRGKNRSPAHTALENFQRLHRL
jgi:4-diphosphocytidyl-2-C-methyl-D-erythritol kinase